MMRSTSRALEQLHGLRDREPGLAGAGGADAEGQRVALERADVGVLRRGARPHRALAQVDFLECGSREFRVEVEQRALRNHGADRALDVALSPARGRARPVRTASPSTRRAASQAVARSGDGDVVAALVDDDVEPAFDQREVLAIVAEQDRSRRGYRRTSSDDLRFGRGRRRAFARPRASGYRGRACAEGE